MSPLRRASALVLIFQLFLSLVGTAAPAIVRLLPDPARNRLYAVQTDGQNAGSLAVIDTTSRVTIKTLPMGRKPTDCDIGDHGATLFVINSVDATIQEIDLESLTPGKLHALPGYINSDPALTHGHVRAGKGDTLYFVDGQIGPRLRVFDRKSGAVLQIFGATGTGTSTSEGIGGLVIDPAGTTIYTWSQSGWSPGGAWTYLSRFAIQPDGTLGFPNFSGTYYQIGLQRDPLDTPALMSADGSSLFVKARSFSIADFPNKVVNYPKEIYAATPNGAMVATSTTLFSSKDATSIASLPKTSTVQAVMPDYSALAYVDAATQVLGWLDLPTTVGTVRMGLSTLPADGVAALDPRSLEWLPVAGARSYQVRISTVRSDLEAATPPSNALLGQTRSTSFPLAAPLVKGTYYFWRVTAIDGAGNVLDAGSIRSFNIPDLSLSRNSITSRTLTGNPRQRESLRIEAPSGVAWTATADVPWISFDSASGMASGDPGIVIDTRNLAAGTYTAKLALHLGTDALELPVSLTVYAANFTHAAADPSQPWVYAVSQLSETLVSEPSFLVRIDAATARIESAVECGVSVSALAVHDAENRIYVTNWQPGVLQVLDRTTLQPVTSFSYTPAATRPLGNGDVYRVAAGAAGRVIIEANEHRGNSNYLLDTSDGDKVAAFVSSDGSGVFDITGRYYFHGDFSTSNASLRKYDTAGDVIKELGAKRVSKYSIYGSIRTSRSADGSRIFWNGGVFDTDLNVKLDLDQEVLASTAGAELLFTSGTVLNGLTGKVMANLPVFTGIQALSNDRRSLLLFKSGAITRLDLQTITGLGSSAIASALPTTVNGPRQSLSWTAAPTAIGYRVYLGTSEDAVRTATPSSPEFLGYTGNTSWSENLPTFALGQSWFWRVETVGYSETRPGAVWSFRISQVEATPANTSVVTVRNGPVERRHLALASAGAPVEWSVSSPTPWIRIVKPSGITSSPIEYDVVPAGLAAGSYTGSIMLSDGISSSSIPVTLRVTPLNVIKMLSHPARQIAYAINANADGNGGSMVLELDSATAAILRVLPIAGNLTGGDLSPDGSLLHLFYAQDPSIHVLDVNAWSESRKVETGKSIYSLSSLPDPTRFLAEIGDNNGTIAIYSASTGEIFDSRQPVGRGGGQADPTGRFYYHIDDRQSNDIRLTLHDLSLASFPVIASQPVSPAFHGRKVIVSGDSRRVFCNQSVFDSELKLLSTLSEETLATNRSGALSISTSALWWSEGGPPIASFPFTCSSATISAADSYLVSYDANTQSLRSTSLPSLVALPGPYPRPEQVLSKAPDALSWSPVDGAVSYKVYLATSKTALQSMTTPTATVTGTSYPLTQPLLSGTYYFWRVDAVKPAGTAAGTVRSFAIPHQKIAGYDLSPGLDDFSNLTAVSLSGNHFLIASQKVVQLYEFDSTTSFISPVQTLVDYNNSSLGSLSAKGAVMDGGKAIWSDPDAANPAAYAGTASVLRQNPRDFWEIDALLTPGTPVSGQQFGASMAASGNLLLVGAYGHNGLAGRVSAWITEPKSVRLQEFAAADSVVNDLFGRAIAIDGNQAVITASGYGPNNTRTPSVYFFTRSTSTGLWSQTQKLAIPNANFGAGEVVVVSGNIAAVSNPSNGRVEIYTRNTRASWSWSTAISSTTIVGTASTYFGRSLALSGNRLFVGDLVGEGTESKTSGRVFVFNFVNGAWIQAPSIASVSETGLGGYLSVDDQYLLASSSDPKMANIYQVGEGKTRIPRFSGELPSYAVAGRELHVEIRATDEDEGDTLTFQLVQAPGWMTISNSSNGTAELEGVPPSASPPAILQVRVRDSTGNERLLATGLTILASDDLPVLSKVPAPQTLGEGQELVLRAAGSGNGPLQWQWFRDGEPIPGANLATYSLQETRIENSGRYRVELTNPVGTLKSVEFTVTVTPPGRFAGDWTTFGNGATRSGHHPALLGHHDFVPAWSRKISSTLNRAVTGDGRIYVENATGYVENPGVTAVNFETGKVDWTRSFEYGVRINPLTFHQGTIYFQSSTYSANARFSALDAANGSTRWSSPLDSQSGAFEAPAVTDDGIWLNSGNSGGFYGFNPDGTQRFFHVIPEQTDNWTPAVAGGRVYSCVAGIFREHNPADGSTRWSVYLGRNDFGSGLRTAPAVQGNSAMVLGTLGIACIDLETRAIRWRHEGNFEGSPAIAGGRVYAIQNKTVVSFDLTDGTAGPKFDFPADIISEQPLLTDDHLFVSGSASTYVSELASGRVVQTLPGGGYLSFANGHLLVAGNEGTLRSWYARGRLEFDEIPAIRANDDADDLSVDLNPSLRDPENYGTFAWELIGNSNPRIFSMVSLDQTGRLQLRFAPYVSGTSQISIRVTGPDNQIAAVTFEVILPDLPVPKIEVDPTITFNRATGLYDQKLVVTNIAARAISGFDLTVSGLGEQIRLYNGAGGVAGGGTFSHRGVIPAGAQVNLVLSYHALIRGNVGQPVIVSAVAIPTPTKGSDKDRADDRNASAASASAHPFTIERYEILADGAVKIIFPASPAMTYRVQSSDDLLHWFPVSEVLTTETPGLLEWSAPTRATKAISSPGKLLFYRVERVSP